jgi:hypothetical protein
MNFFLLVSVLFGSIQALACPEISGTFGGICTQKSSCGGTQSVYKAYQLSQVECSEIHIGSLLPTGEVLLESSYLIGEELVEEAEGGRIVSLVTYSTDELIRTEDHGWIRLRDSLKRLHEERGEFLKVETMAQTQRCLVTTTCELPALYKKFTSF